MNPAALKVHVGDLRPGALIIVDEGAFTERGLAKAGYSASPLTDGSLAAFRILAIDMTRLTLAATKPIGLGRNASLLCKNMWALGLVLWLFGRDKANITTWIKTKFADQPSVAQANLAALEAGHVYGEAAELPQGVSPIMVRAALLPSGEYRTITGVEAASIGLLAASALSGLPLFLGSYPITPATPILHYLAAHQNKGVIAFQAEDEIAAICAALGASYGGALAVTASSGPGIALKTEAIGLAIATELPLVVVNVQRGGPSTGLPTKTEQSDLLQAVFGRNGDAPLPVIAARDAGDCFDCAVLAARLAIKYMTPVMLLLDGYIANAAEPWRLPDLRAILPIEARVHIEPQGFSPYKRDPTTLARAWATPGTPGLAHRIGGIERDAKTGNISYDPANHDLMTRLRVAKVRGVNADTPRQEVDSGEATGDLVMIGWGGTYGPMHMAVKRARAQGWKVSHIHLRHLWPLPENLGDLLAGFDKVIVAELNSGQLKTLLQSQFDRKFGFFNKVSGQPFRIAELLDAILAELGESKEVAA
jgi:2-oxoglutarate ferredoxin oxidoreductase subunit alpha